MNIKLLLSASVVVVATAGLARQATDVPAAGSTQAAAATSAAAPVDEKAARAAAAAAEKAQRAAQAAERKRMADLQRKYGMGPYPDEITEFLANKPAPLQPLYRTLFTGGERNAVLNFERLGLAAMDQGYWKDAENAFDGALQRIEAVYANNKQAEAARSVFHNEANKDFKGEPYERAMAYYYRGLLYLRAGDYDNARASFRSAEYQDTVSEVENYKSDFAVMNYLTGWTYHCQGSNTSAEEAFTQAQTAEPGLRSPAPNETVLMIAELGRGPVKARDGAQAQKLVFKPGAAVAETGATFDLTGSAPLPTVAASSVYYQATTRGGRAIDGILAGKANFKATTGAIGDVAMQTGMSQMSGGDFSDGAVGMAAVGAIFSMFSSAAKTQADIRGWDNLPDAIMIGTAAAPAKPVAAKVRYWAGTNPTTEAAAPMMSQTAGKCTIVWSRSQSSAGLSADVPGEDPGVAAALARKAPIQLKDKAFRSALAGSSVGLGS
jgi:tetratricopeptide (TPR) repeat protein